MKKIEDHYGTIYVNGVCRAICRCKWKSRETQFPYMAIEYLKAHYLKKNKYLLCRISECEKFANNGPYCSKHLWQIRNDGQGENE